MSADEQVQAAEAELWRDYRAGRDVALRTELFERYQPLARAIARRCFQDRRTGDLEYADLFQSAATGLLEAIDRFEPERGVAFAAFARPRITGAVLDSLPRLSERREQIAFRNRVRRARAQSVLERGRAARTTQEALEALVEAALGLAVGFMLEAPGVYVAAETHDPGPSPYESAAWAEAVGRLRGALDDLPPNERTVIRQHYLMGLDFTHIAVMLDLTKGRVSQLHRAGLERLRRRLRRGPWAPSQGGP